MTPQEMIAQAELLFFQAALDTTSLDRRMRRAAELVIIRKMRPAAAARDRHVKRHRNNVLRAVKLVRERIEVVKKDAAERAAA